MNDPRHQLTPEIQRQTCALIRSGAFPHVAAEVAGVPQKVFERWMKWGKAARPVPLYRDFFEAVCMAQAHARAVAENHVFVHAPITWLKCGPGKETARSPGGTSPVKPRPLPLPKPGMSVSEERLQTFITVNLGALKLFPDARAAAADALDAYGWGEEPMSELPPEMTTPAADATPSRDGEQPGTGTTETTTAQAAAQPVPVRVETKELEGLFVTRVPGMEFKMLGAVPEWPTATGHEVASVSRKGVPNPQANDIEPAANPQFASSEPVPETRGDEAEAAMKSKRRATKTTKRHDRRREKRTETRASGATSVFPPFRVFRGHSPTVNRASLAGASGWCGDGMRESVSLARRGCAGCRACQSRPPRRRRP